MTEQESRDRIVAQQMLLARECFDDAADYGDFLDIPREQVVNTLETARRFVAAMQAGIDSSGRS